MAAAQAGHDPDDPNEMDGESDELGSDHFGEEGAGFSEFELDNVQQPGFAINQNPRQEERKEREPPSRAYGPGLIPSNIIGGRAPQR
jgi:hypothetical protein